MQRILITLFIFFLEVSKVWAVQVHGPPEGFYSHILAHILFTISILFILYFSRRHPMGAGKAWLYFRISLILFLLWNLDTMMVHFLDLRLPEEALYLSPNPFEHKLYGPLTFERWVYYIGRFDHLICVPAMWFMVQSLRTFYREFKEQKVRN